MAPYDALRQPLVIVHILDYCAAPNDTPTHYSIVEMLNSHFVVLQEIYLN